MYPPFVDLDNTAISSLFLSEWPIGHQAYVAAVAPQK
jgi:hypothetical protein